MVAFVLGRHLPAHRVHAERTHLAEDGAHRAVLATRVQPLQDHEQLVAPIGVEEVLQRVELERELHHRGAVGIAVAAGVRPRLNEAGEIELAVGRGNLKFIERRRAGRSVPGHASSPPSRLTLTSIEV
jgi:hypothetical protein